MQHQTIVLVFIYLPAVSISSNKPVFYIAPGKMPAVRNQWPASDWIKHSCRRKRPYSPVFDLPYIICRFRRSQSHPCRGFYFCFDKNATNSKTAANTSHRRLFRKHSAPLPSLRPAAAIAFLWSTLPLFHKTGRRHYPYLLTLHSQCLRHIPSFEERGFRPWYFRHIPAGAMQLQYHGQKIRWQNLRASFHRRIK